MGQGLRDRVRDRAAALPIKTVDAVLPHAVHTATTAQGEPDEVSLVEQIRAHRDTFAKAAPNAFDVNTLIEDVEVALTKVRNLNRCDALSVLGAMMTAAQLGLRIGVFGQSWLEPIKQSRFARDDRNKWVSHHRARLIIGYQGLRDLAMRSPQVRDLTWHIVRQGDEFDYAYGLDDHLTHKPQKDGLAGESTHYYAIVRYANGGRDFEVLNRAEAELHRDKYASKRRWDPKTEQRVVVGAWKTHFEEMAAKTVFRRLSKRVSMAADLAAALEADGAIRVDLNPRGILTGQHLTDDGHPAPDETHDGGHGETLAWSPDCEACASDQAGQRHFVEHATAEPANGCAYCDVESDWRAPTASTS